MKSKRFGKFIIDWKVIDENPGLVQSIMAECIIIRAEAMYESETMEYTAISDHFVEVRKGHTPMTYGIEVQKYTSPHTDKVSFNWHFT